MERRDRAFVVGVAEAVHHLATHRMSNQYLIDSLLKGLVGEATHEDDIAIVVIEHV